MRGLRGKSVLLTRAVDSNESMIHLLESHDARAVVLPAIEIADPDSWEDVDRSIINIRKYDGVFFTSKNAVERFLQRADTINGDAKSVLQHRTVYAVGEKTEEALEQAGIPVAGTPEVYSAEALTESLSDQDFTGKCFLFPRSNIGKDVIPAYLRMKDAEVDEILVYKNVPPQQQELDAVRNALASQEIDVVTFFSPSAVRNFLQMMGSKSLEQTRIAVIGPSTASAVESLGFSVDIIAKQATAESLVETIAEYFLQP